MPEGARALQHRRAERRCTARMVAGDRDRNRARPDDMGARLRRPPPTRADCSPRGHEAHGARDGMTSIAKPPVRHPSLQQNALGLTKRDYEGAMSTLCAGCGHDSVTASLVQAFWELDLPPHRAAKLSGIGCSSK